MMIKTIQNALQNKIQNTLQKCSNVDDSHEFKPILSEIEESPESPLGLFTFWTISALIIITIAWLIIGKVDVVVSARGIIIPDGEIKVIQPLEAGSIRNILVKEGDFVKKGQILVEIDSSATEPALASTTEIHKKVQTEIKRLNAQAGGEAFLPPPPVAFSPEKGGYLERSQTDFNTDETQSRLYNSNIAKREEQLKAKQAELKAVHEDFNAAKAEKENYENLLASSIEREKRMKNVLDIIAKDEYIKELNNIKSYQTEVKKAESKLLQAKNKKNQINNEIGFIKQSFNSETLNELAEKQKQEQQLKSEVEQIKFKNIKQNIISPVDGYVDKLFVHTIGGVVTPAEKIIAITPSDMPLVIKATVLNQDIGFIKKGAPVQIKIDTFSFQKYGLLDGVVKSVSKSSMQDEKLGPVYEIYVTPLENTLVVEGKKERITTGMSLSAEVKVGKRRIIEFFIYPLIKYFNEGISVR